MIIKDLERTANIAWSPANLSQIYLAAGTAGQQLDASFNTNASLEIFSLNLNEPGSEMELTVGVASDKRFHKLAWSSHGGEAGTIVGGCEGGELQIYDAAKMLAGDGGLIGRQEKHTGAVHSLDFNPFQGYLLASGAASSEIFIWDLNNLNSPMTPGSKSQPFEDIVSIQWNRQVEHILASTFASKCVVWDLRKNETIIKLTDTVSRVRWKVVAWHPEVATQLCLASEEDQSPVVQLWDLRFATSPLKTLENHQRGVLSMAWCSQDADLLATGGKDNRIVCWNPNSNQSGGEVLSEVARTNQWSFDITWCPKNPALLASPSLAGHISVYSVLGGKGQQIQTTNKIADSFPGMDAGDYVQAPHQQACSLPVSTDLSKAPKWLKKPVSATFGFGGKLITFDHDKSGQQHQVNGQGNYVPRRVYISQVVTETAFVKKSTELEQVLEYGNFTDYCRSKADATCDQHTRFVWHFLKANFEPNPRTELLNLLGYKIEDANMRLAQHVPRTDVVPDLNEQCPPDRIDSEDVFAKIQIQNLNINNSAAKPVTAAIPYKIITGDEPDGLIAQALLMNNVEAAAALCIKSNRYADALVIAMTGGPELFHRIQIKYLAQCKGYVSSLISALVTEDWASVIRNCDVESWREALAAALTHASDDDLPLLCELMGNRLEAENLVNGDAKLLEDAQLCFICAGSFDKLVKAWRINDNQSVDDLQGFVELITFLQKSVERQGRRVEINGELAQLLSKYAMLLASQGNLSTALSYLSTSSNDPHVTALKERLHVALGQKPAYGGMMNRSRRDTGRSSISSTRAYPPAAAAPKQFNTGLPNANTPQAWTQPLTSQPSWQPQSMHSPMPQQTSVAGVSSPWHTPASAVPSPGTQWAPVAPPANSQPSLPGSVGATGLPKNKYIVDPSVQTGGYGMPAMRNNFPLAQQVSVPQVSLLTPTGSFGTSSVGTPMFNPPEVAPQPLLSQSLGEMPMSVPTSIAPVPNHAQAAMNALPAHAAAGWNDPPVLSKSAKQPAKSDINVRQDAITHPIFGTAPVQHIPTNGYMDDPNMPMPPRDPFNPYMNRPQQPFDSPAYTPQTYTFNRNAVMQQSQLGSQCEAAAPLQSAMEPPPKLPIPEEHIHMQTVLNELRVQCGRATSNPQTKRKIEDVARKLETLYDLLREHKLSSSSLAGLHQIIQSIQHGDYTGGLAMHVQMVSGPDFAQIAGFMPGIKVLMQCAMQLGVYLR